MTTSGGPWPHEAEAPHPRRYWILTVLGFGVFMTSLDSSILNIALPTLSDSLHAELGLVEWVVLAYLLTVTGLLVSIGRLGDIFGRRHLYLAGYAVFTGGSLLCALSQSAPQLIAARVVQAAGAALLQAIEPAIAADVFPPREIGRAMGWIAMWVSVGTSMGPAVGGLLLSAFGWRSIFMVNLPVGVVAFVVALRIIPQSTSAGHTRFDPLGAALFLSGTVCVLLGLTQGQGRGWGNPAVLALFAAGLALLAAFIGVELRVPAPMIQLAMFRSRAFSASLLVSYLTFIALSGQLFVLPFFLQDVLRFEPWQMGLVMLTGPLCLATISPLGGWMADRFGPRIMASLGLAAAAAASFWQAGLSPAWGLPQALSRWLAVNLSRALFQSANSSAILNSSPPRERGVAASLMAFTRNLGNMSGTAAGAAVWVSRRAAHAHELRVDDLAVPAQVAGMRDVFLAATAILVVAATLSLFRDAPVPQPRRPRRPAVPVLPALSGDPGDGGDA